MNQGGNYWTLFTPGIWKVLHAVFHTCPTDPNPLDAADHAIFCLVECGLIIAGKTIFSNPGGMGSELTLHFCSECKCLFVPGLYQFIGVRLSATLGCSAGGCPQPVPARPRADSFAPVDFRLGLTHFSVSS